MVINSICPYTEADPPKFRRLSGRPRFICQIISPGINRVCPFSLNGCIALQHPWKQIKWSYTRASGFLLLPSHHLVLLLRRTLWRIRERNEPERALSDAWAPCLPNGTNPSRQSWINAKSAFPRAPTRWTMVMAFYSIIISSARLLLSPHAGGPPGSTKNYFKES